MPASPLNDFLASLKAIEYTRRRSEELFVERSIVLRDLHSVYEALFLRAVTSFEAFLESLFIAIMKEKISYKKNRKIALRMKASSHDALMEILLQRQAYMMWLPFRHTEERALLYLKDGRPFSELDDADRSMLKTITTIRNAIAHKSFHAMAEFHRTVIGSRSLLPKEKNPAGFLRSPTRGSTRNQFETYMIELGGIAKALS
jgi:hypothetical protein